LEFGNLLVPLVSVVAGLVVERVLGIEAALKRLGDYLKKWYLEGVGLVSGTSVTTTLLVCVGPPITLTIIELLEDGLRDNYSLLALKSTLYFIAALTFASVLGWGVLLSVSGRYCSCRVP